MEESKSDLLERFTEIITRDREKDNLEIDEAQKIIIDSLMNNNNAQEKMFIISGSGKTSAWLDIVRNNLKEDNSYFPLKREEIDIAIIGYIESMEQAYANTTALISGLSLSELMIEEVVKSEEKAKEPNMRVTTRNFLNKGRRW